MLVVLAKYNSYTPKQKTLALRGFFVYIYIMISFFYPYVYGVGTEKNGEIHLLPSV